MIIVVIDSGICTGVYEYKEGPENEAVIVDLDAADSGDNPVSSYDLEDVSDMDAKAKRLFWKWAKRGRI